MSPPCCSKADALGRSCYFKIDSCWDIFHQRYRPICLFFAAAGALILYRQRARIPITAALMIMAVASAMLQVKARPLTKISSAVEASGVM